jgi:Capsular polysaccharide synthesis protein
MIVWSMWTGPMNECVEDCVGSWARHHPEWDVRMLDDAGVRQAALDLPSTYDQLGPAAKSDAVRLQLLARHGGLWMDATVMLRARLDWLDGSGDLVGFRQQGSPYVESWLLFAWPGGRVAQWSVTLNSILELHPDCTRHVAYSASGQTSRPDYFMIYQAYIYLDETVPGFRSGASLGDAGPHLNNLLHPRLVKYTARTRALYNRRRHIVVGTLLAASLVLALLVLGQGICFTRR